MRDSEEGNEANVYADVDVRRFCGAFFFLDLVNHRPAYEISRRLLHLLEHTLFQSYMSGPGSTAGRRFMNGSRGFGSIDAIRPWR